ncbi:MAG: rhamnogalacturonan lyase [Bacteroidota bacterium]|nr:rhamnogalacturonan lyase [Bacteroidota bacterium]
MKKITSLVSFLVLMALTVSNLNATPRQMEYLDRGLVAVKITNGVFLSWRFLGTDNPATGFNIYRDNVLVNSTPINTCTNFTDANGTSASVYKVIPVLNGVEDATGIKTVTPWAQQYKTIQLNRPANGITSPNKYGSVGKPATGSFPKGQPYGYSPNDCSVGDVDGDGEYEIIVKWAPSNSQDNSYYGITGDVYIDAYKLDGTQLWRIDLGKNIRAGAHYTQFLVYDFDGDGLAEVVCKTAPGTIDGKGNYVIMTGDDPAADYRSIDTTQLSGSKMLGTIQTGPEYLTLFDGKTGAELNTIAYNPPRGSVSAWGDNYANRSDRFLACVAYLDGVHPSAVMCRGYYTRATLASYDVQNKKLVQHWFYDSGSTSGVGAYGQGNHNLSVADVDSDGKDEIIYGSCAIDDNGTLLYHTGLGHGDAMHVSDMDPDNPGLEVWAVHEETNAAYGYELHDAKTGTVLWGTKTGADNGRGLAADIDSRYPGFEMWSSLGSGTYSCKGTQISTSKPSTNFRIYWDGDLQDELLDGTNITKWNGNGTTTLLSCTGTSSCNSTKATPNLSADILGDWREEVILWTSADSSKLRIYTTTTPTTYRLFTPMHDPVYRLGVAWQNTAYNQPPHLGFYIGDGLANVTQPNIKTIKYNAVISGVQNPVEKQHAAIYNANGILKVNSSEVIHSVSIYSELGRLLYQNDSVQNQEFSRKLPGNEHLVIVKVKTNSGAQTAKVLF